MGAMIVALVMAHRGRILDALIGIVIAVVFFGSLPLLGLEAWAPLWALVLIVFLVLLQRRQVAGEDARLALEEATERAERRAAIMRGDS